MFRPLLPAVAALGLSHLCCAQDLSIQREAQLKAAYIFNFMKFVDWDARDTDRTVDVCFVDDSAIREALSADASDKLIGTRSLMTRTVAQAGRDCDVVYVEGERASAPWPAGLSALIIGDHPSVIASGGTIQLYTENNRLRFVVHMGNARRTGLQISSNLLKLATRVDQ